MFIFLYLYGLIFIGFSLRYEVGASNIVSENTTELEVFKVIGDIFLSNYKDNGWSAILCYDAVPDEFYVQMQHLRVTHLRMDAGYAPPPSTLDYGFPYQLNTAVITCDNYSDCSVAFQRVTKIHYWNPHANMILNIKDIKDPVMVARIFYTFWWHQSLSVIIVHYDKHSDTIELYNYNPYTYDGYQLQTAALCWAKKRWSPFFFENIPDYVECEIGCENLKTMALRTKKYLVTCLSFEKQIVSLKKYFQTLAPFKIIDQSVNMHGYPLKAHGSQTPPFLQIDLFENGTYEVRRRDGDVWRALSERMNFTIQLIRLDMLEKRPFSYITNTKMILDMSYRLLDFILFPIYQLDLLVSPTELCAPLRASGVCILGPRADFVTSWYATQHFGYGIIALFLACMVSVWSTIALFNYFETGRWSLDQLGKDFCNTLRNVLSLSLHRAPQQESFRVYLAISLWCFFLLNFILQASIVSFMTVIKRGKEVETIAEVVERGYPVKGFWSPDMFLPDDEEVFVKFNSLKALTEDLYECVNELEYNPRMFCLLDCTIAQYLEKNKLNRKGEQYLHVLRERVHSLFLNMMLPYKSPLRRTMNKYFMALIEGGFVKKFEGYRYDEIHEPPTSFKPIRFNDLSGIFQLYFIANVFTVAVFLCEVQIGVSHLAVQYIMEKIRQKRMQLRTSVQE